MQTRVYLDANASHPLLLEVRQIMAQDLMGSLELGNPSSLHEAGRRSKKIINELKRELEKATSLKSSDWVLLSGATEALNLALSVAHKNSWRICVSEVEHSAVLRFCEKKLSDKLTMLVVGEDGALCLKALARHFESFAGQPCLLALQTHNNETGLPLIPKSQQKDFLNLLAQHPQVYLLLDLVQSLGKAEFSLWKDLVDKAAYVAVSAHKVGGMMGVGALWVRDKVPFEPLVLGGLQESGKRAGTEPVWGAFSWLEALKVWSARGENIRACWKAQKNFIVNEFRSHSQFEILNVSHEDEVLANTIVLSVKNTSSELVLQKLDLKGVSVSSGSACRSGITMVSHVLRAIGKEAWQDRAVLRVSLPADLSQADVEYFVRTLKEII